MNDDFPRFNEWVDTSCDYDDPVMWVAHSIATYTTMMSLEFPSEFKKLPKEEKRGTLKLALKDVLTGIEKGIFNSFSYRQKEFVYSLRGWWQEGILDFLFADEKIWTSKKWDIQDVRKNTPKALALLIEDVKD